MMSSRQSSVDISDGIFMVINSEIKTEQDKQFVEEQRQKFQKMCNERQQRREELQREIYNESSCYDKLKINLRDFFVWLIYK